MSGFLSDVLCLGPIESNIYTVNNGVLYVSSFTGDITHSYVFGATTQPIIGITAVTPLKCRIDYEGAIFITVESDAQYTLFREWHLSLSQQSLILYKSVKYSASSSYSFDYKGLTVQRYDKVLVSPVAVGVRRVYLNNTSLLTVGQKCILGPSTAGTSTDKIFSSYISQVFDAYIEIADSSAYDFKIGDNVSFFDDLIFVSGKGLGGSSIPSFYYIERELLYVKSTASLYQLRNVNSAFFLNNVLYLVSDTNVYLYDCVADHISLVIYSYHNCGGYLSTYGIIPQNSGNFYTVQTDYVEYSNFSCTVKSLGGLGLVPNTQSIYVNAIAVSVDGFSYTPGYIATGVVFVLDQYGRGVYGRRVYVVSDDTSSIITSSNWFSDSVGCVYFQYTYGTNHNQTVKAYTQTTYQHRSSDYVYGFCYLIRSYLAITSSYTLYTYAITSIYSMKAIALKAVIYNYHLLERLLRIYYKLMMFDKIGITTGIKCVLSVLAKTTSIYTLLPLSIQYKMYAAASAYINGYLTESITITTFIFISYFKPDPFSMGNPLNSLIEFFIYPSSYAFDIPTFSFKIREINESLGLDTGWVDVTDDGTVMLIDIGGRYAIKFAYDSAVGYNYGSIVYCCINIYDKAPIPNKYVYCCYFGIITDNEAPITVMTTPKCGDINVPQNADIGIIVFDGGVGVNNTSCRLYIDGVPVYYTVYTTSSGTIYVYHPTFPYFLGSTVTFSWDVEDVMGNILHDTCYFNVIESEPPIIESSVACGDIVDNRFSFTFDVYDAGTGVKYDSIELVLYNKDVPFIHDKILYRVK